MDERPGEADIARERLVYLSDGVFAIAITLLLLEITIPALPRAFAVQEAELPGALLGLRPQILTYAISFIIIGVYWTAHQRIFHYITRVNGVLIWLNIVFLMSVAFLPLPTAVLGRYGDHGAAVRFYALSIMVAGLVIVVLWWYATSGHRLVDARLDPALIRHHVERSPIAPVVFVLCSASPTSTRIWLRRACCSSASG